ncbi:hypothetical protein STIUS_v1c01560 [Spiroplasma sp. TIUS-1]|uniref:hypothetical protein n=1 Tax=Spiroplasma sp. TIUS-1 TaxID=216963 RepID=UPI001397116E|nr:hypothetical protein [Spiroplasma sp. TIUS-1]QHX35711.1 hypothetical protein STIUS_v1c01560 [Spiroplasma sp. TIUS-1]
MKNWWLGVQAEFGSRIGSSKKRIIKFIGISLVPILYAVVCVLAFWNPIPGIGKAPTAIIDTEQKVYVGTNQKFEVLGKNLLKESNESELSEAYRVNTKLSILPHIGVLTDDIESLKEAIVKDENKEVTKDDFTGSLSKTIDMSNVNYVYAVNTWTLMEANLLNHKGGNKYEAKKAISEEEIFFSNITHLQGKEAEDNYKNPKYYLQMKFDDGLASGLVTKIGLMLQGKLFDNPAKQENLKIWTTFENNFIFGYYLKTLNSFRSAIPSLILEKVVDNIKLEGISKGELKTKLEVARDFAVSQANNENSITAPIWTKIANSLNEAITLLESVGGEIDAKVTKIIQELIKDVINIVGLGGQTNNIIDVEIQGLKNGNNAIAIYGIGLGEFFILIGMFVGTLMQTFVYDRAKRVKKLTNTQWYLSKTFLMWTTGMLQVGLLVLALTAAGWWIIGALALVKLWLWLMVVETVFVITIQALWFSLKDETIGKFLVVVYMVLNLSSGWGTFPAFMQFGFFNAISYITEFKYALHGMTSIIYSNGDNALFMFKQLGVLLIFMAVLITIGLIFSRNRDKEMYFGSYRGKQVYDCLQSLGKTELADEFRTKRNNGKSFKYNWKVLGKEPMKDLVLEVRKKYPFEGQFKWFKNKERDEVLKPNYSDDDVISRNDDVTV